MENNQERAGKKKARILKSAIALFLQNGPKKVTMDDIAGRANVSKMTVYKYFNDKESLYKYAAEDLMAECRRDLSEKLMPQQNTVLRMAACTKVLTGFIANGCSSLCDSLGELNDSLQEEIERFHTDIKETVLSLIHEGKSGGLIREDIPDECIYRYIDMGLCYFRHNSEYRRKMQDDPSFRKDFLTFLWGNVFTDLSHFTA